jgi:hypothetical protein
MFKQSTYITQLIKSPTILIQIVRVIERKLNRNITDLEETKILNYIQHIPQSYLENIPSEQLINKLSKKTIAELHLNNYYDSTIDIHEMLKNNIGETLSLEPTQQDMDKIAKESLNVNVGSIFGFDDMATVIKKINEPISSVNTAYFLLDSKYRILENDGTSYFKWGHINSLVRAQGTYNSIGNIRDIISIKVMKYRLPNVNNVITPYGRVTMLIHELSPQSFVAHEERRFHFIGETIIVNDYVEVCSDDFSDGEFKFNKPITHLGTITLSFATPLEPVLLDKDRLQGTITSYTNPTTITFPEYHNLLPTDNIYINNFTTKNNTNDESIINKMNIHTGLKSTKIDETSISVPVDTSSIINTLSGTVDSPSELLAGTITVTNNSNIIIGIGTSFVSDFNNSDYIEIQDGASNGIFKISKINSNNKLTINTAYPKLSGTSFYRKTSTIIMGTLTKFQKELYVNDYIMIDDGATNPLFKIISIQSNTQLTIENPYNGIDGIGFTINKNNNANKNISVFFGSKRVFIPIEIVYLSSSQ